MKTYVLYHGNCPDGFGSAWSAQKVLDAISKSVEYIPITYGSEFPEIEDGSIVYMLDYSTDAETLRKLGKKNRVIILDHHKTAEKNLSEFPVLHRTWNIQLEHKSERHNGVFVRFDMNKSGAMLSWEYFYPHTPAPHLIKYVQDRDLWRHDLEGSREFNAHLRCYDFTFKAWDEVHNMTSLMDFIETGKKLLIQDQQNINMICSSAKLIEYRDHKVAIVGSTSHWSDVGNQLVNDYPEADYTMSFYYSPKSNILKMSLRCKDGFDVSEVASEFGGGGHQKASGYVIKGADIANFFTRINREDEL